MEPKQTLTELEKRPEQLEGKRRGKEGLKMSNRHEQQKVNRLLGRSRVQQQEETPQEGMKDMRSSILEILEER